MVADATAVRTELTRDEAGRLLGHTMALMAVTAGAFALDAYLGQNLAYQWGWLFFIGSLMCLVGVNAMARRSEQSAITVLVAFGVLTGLAVAPTLAPSYTGTRSTRAATSRPGRSRNSYRKKSEPHSDRFADAPIDRRPP
jgi:YD repeat-containing protein